MDGGEMWIIANFKANKNIKESIEWVELVGPKLKMQEGVKVVVCPSFSAIEQVKKTILVGSFPLMVGSQDISSFPKGAYTGEEPAAHLAGFIDLSIIGHSERREHLKETDEIVEKKVNQAKSNGIIPLVCVQDINTKVPDGSFLIAYEPVWAIGTGKADTPADANKVAQTFKQRYGEDLEVLYGGSVNKDNIKSFIKQDSLSGVLVATASLNPEGFLAVLSACID